MAAVLLIPEPQAALDSAGKASVMMAEELAKSMAPPTPWPTRIPMSHRAAGVPVSQVTASRREKAVKTMKPRLKILHPSEYVPDAVRA